MTATGHVERVAEALAAADGYAYGLKSVPPGSRSQYLKLAQAAIEALGLTEEHQWVPIAEDGSRWEPRSEGDAEAAMIMNSRDFGEPWNITRIDHESRLVSPWVQAGAR